MGDPKHCRRKYYTPSHPWEGERIKAENELVRTYGLKNKKEVWKAESLLRNFRHQARTILARSRTGEVEAEKETTQLLGRLARLGFLPLGATLDDVLALEIDKVLSRRFQTLAYLKGLAHTPKQARQFIIHGHIAISGRKVTIPGYLVKQEEEPMIEYYVDSVLNNELHPMRPKPGFAMKEPEKPKTTE